MIGQTKNKEVTRVGNRHPRRQPSSTDWLLTPTTWPTMVVVWTLLYFVSVSAITEVAFSGKSLGISLSPVKDSIYSKEVATSNALVTMLTRNLENAG